MNKNRKLKIACSCIITIGLLIVSLKYLTELMELKVSDSKYLPFLEQDEDFDVLFLGSSHAYTVIYPMELWNDYGIVSYNLGGSACFIPMTYWVMENALEQTNPKVVVIDCYMLGEMVKATENLSKVHSSLDAFPLNMTKLLSVLDLLNDPVMDELQLEEVDGVIEKRTRLELLWDYSIYHARWNELSKDDFIVLSNKGKGAELRVAIATPDEFVQIPVERKLEGETTGIIYLRRMIEDCQSREIEVLLLYAPFPASIYAQMEANRVYDIAEEYGVNYINFLDMDIVDYNTDCYDASSHLNASGAQKVTNYIGQYIAERYDIADQRNDPAFDSWYEDYREWTGEKINILKAAGQLDVYLMLLADQHLDAKIEINNPAIWEDEYYVRFLNNIGIYEEDYRTKTETSDNSGGEDNPDVHITVRDRATGEIVDQEDFSL